MLAAFMVVSMGGCKLLKGKQKKPFGEECVTDLDCESLSCSTYGNICSKTCTYDKDCGGDYVCRIKDDRSGNYCSKAVGQPPNGGCMFGNDCQHGECLHRIGQEDQPGICSKYCASESDCPQDMQICLKISDSGLLKVCLPGSASTPAAERPKFNPSQKAPANYRPPARPIQRPAPAPRPVAQPAPAPAPAPAAAPGRGPARGPTGPATRPKR